LLEVISFEVPAESVRTVTGVQNWRQIILNFMYVSFTFLMDNLNIIQMYHRVSANTTCHVTFSKSVGFPRWTVRVTSVVPSLSCSNIVFNQPTTQKHEHHLKDYRKAQFHLTDF